MTRRPALSRILLVVALSATFALSTGFTAPQRRARRPAAQRIAPPSGLDAAGPDVADVAPDLTLTDIEGNEVRLSDLWSRGALLLVLGSATSPEFRATARDLQLLAERLHADVQMALVYTMEAQPTGSPGLFTDEGRPAVPAGDFARAQAGTLAERRASARFIMEKFELGMPLQVLVDDMGNGAWSGYGPAPNNAFAIDRRGSVVGRQTWFDAGPMEGILRDLLARDQRAPTTATSGEGADETGEGGQP